MTEDELRHELETAKAETARLSIRLELNESTDHKIKEIASWKMLAERMNHRATAAEAAIARVREVIERMDTLINMVKKYDHDPQSRVTEVLQEIVDQLRAALAGSGET